MRSIFSLNKWQVDNNGWRILSLNDGWIFLIDPKMHSHKSGIEIFLCKELDLVKKSFAKTHTVQAAVNVCDKLKDTKGWVNYTPR